MIHERRKEHKWAFPTPSGEGTPYGISPAVTWAITGALHRELLPDNKPVRVPVRVPVELKTTRVPEDTGLPGRCHQFGFNELKPNSRASTFIKRGLAVGIIVVGVVIVVKAAPVVITAAVAASGVRVLRPATTSVMPLSPRRHVIHLPMT